MAISKIKVGDTEHELQTTIANVTDLQSSLDGKSDTGHTHNYAGSSSAGGAATSANKVNSSLTVKLNGGTTEGTNMFTFNGSAAKAVNITPSAIGAAPTSHASSATTYGIGTGSNYGHVKLSDSTSSTSAASAGVAASPKAVKAAYDLAATKAPKENGFHYIVGTGDTAGTWLATSDEITAYFDGLTVLYKVPIEGLSGTTTLNINSLGAVTVVRNASTAISTAFPVNSVVLLTYTTDDGTAYWKVADYDSNTKTTTSTTNKTDTKLFLAGATSQGSGKTTYSNSNCYVGTDNKLYSGGKVVLNSDDASNIQTQLDAKSPTNHAHDGMNIQPAAIEIVPATNIGHGGYIDFHYNGNTGDYTSRIIESSSGVVSLNNNKILTAANITALYNVSVTFSSGKTTYTNSAIKSTSVCIVQRRSGTAGSATTSMYATTSGDGSITIVTDNTSATSVNLNIFIFNL